MRLRLGALIFLLALVRLALRESNANEVPRIDAQRETGPLRFVQKKHALLLPRRGDEALSGYPLPFVYRPVLLKIPTHVATN